MPDFTYGFGGKVWFKGFDLDFNFQGVYGNEILNLNRRYIDNLEGNTNGTTIALNRWKSPEDPGNGQVNRANRKSKGYNGRTSTWHLGRWFLSAIAECDTRIYSAEELDSALFCRKVESIRFRTKSYGLRLIIADTIRK